MSTRPNAYDLFAYSNHPYADSHPRRLAMLADFFGIEPAPITRCRVLELGCGAGGNILPMALEFPDSEFVGIDLSARAIEAGKADLHALGVKNLTLRHADIADVNADDGQFDYIIAHGIYSWVPPPIRQKMLAIFHDNLSPRGIVYVSYNAFPDGHLRNLIRDLMLFHIRGIEDPAERVAQARAIVKTVAEATDEKTLHGVLMRQQQTRIDRLRDHTLFHDDLSDVSTRFMLYQVMEDAARHGLQYLCDAALWRRWYMELPEGMRALDTELHSNSYLVRDQYLDFVDDCGFRMSLLCHHDIKLNRKVGANQITRYHLASELRPADAAIDPLGEDVVEFSGRGTQALKIDHRLTKAALLHLGRIWPASIAFPDLIGAARASLASHPNPPPPVAEDEVDRVTAALFQAVCSGHIEIYTHPPVILTTISEQPEVSRLARYQAAAGAPVTNLMHKAIDLSGEVVRRFVQLVDGTRTADQLVVDLAAIVAQSKLDVGVHPVTRKSVDNSLAMMVSLALLVK
jgi:SAM-dependent methyltransferase